MEAGKPTRPCMEVSAIARWSIPPKHDPYRRASTIKDSLGVIGRFSEDCVLMPIKDHLNAAALSSNVGQYPPHMPWLLFTGRRCANSSGSNRWS